MKIRTTFLLLLLAVIPVFAVEQIAVSQLRADGLSESQTATLTDVLRSEISKTHKYTVLERSQMDQVLKEQGFQQSGCTDASCAVEIGKLLSVQYIVLGSIGLVGETYTINARVVDVATGKILKDITEYHNGKPDLLLTQVMPIVAQKLCDTYIQPRKRHPLPFILGGFVLVGGGATAALLLSHKKTAEEATSTDVKVTW